MKICYNSYINAKGERSVENKRFLPLVDRLYWFIWVPTLLILIVGTVLSACSLIALLILIATDIFTLYFLVSPLFGYVELREKTVYIKFGFIISREIEYTRIRKVETERKFYSESMTSLKCAFEHVNIKYNRFEVVTVSVKNNSALVAELEARKRNE